MEHMIVQEYNTGKIHKFKLNEKAAYRSLSYEVEYVSHRRRLVIRDYYTGKKLQTIGVDKFGSVQFWVE